MGTDCGAEPPGKPVPGPYTVATTTLTAPIARRRGNQSPIYGRKVAEEKKKQLGWRAALDNGVLYVGAGLFFLSNDNPTTAIIFVVLGVITALAPWVRTQWAARSARSNSDASDCV